MKAGDFEFDRKKLKGEELKVNNEVSIYKWDTESNRRNMEVQKAKQREEWKFMIANIIKNTAY